MTKPRPMPMVGFRLPRVLVLAIKRAAKERRQTPSQYVRDELAIAVARTPTVETPRP